MLSLTTDYATSAGCPRPYLRRIGEVGFSHVHWCHQWNTDFVYADCEIEQIAKWMQEYGLQLNDLHGSSGKEKAWGSPLEYERLAGVALVRNRIDMTGRLGGDVVIMHLPAGLERIGDDDSHWVALRRSLDELEPCAKTQGVRIALENEPFELIEPVLARYGPEYLGLCYDSGHGNMRADGLDRLEGLKDRLISVHLHDNDGRSDQHKLPFSGTVDWRRLTAIIARSSYDKCLSLECTMGKSGLDDEAAFLAGAFEAGTVLSRMVADHRAD